MTIQVTANPHIGCKYPVTVNGCLMRSMTSAIIVGANAGGRRQFTYCKPKNIDPDEGNAYGCQVS